MCAVWVRACSCLKERDLGTYLMGIKSCDNILPIREEERRWGLAMASGLLGSHSIQPSSVYTMWTSPRNKLSSSRTQNSYILTFCLIGIFYDRQSNIIQGEFVVTIHLVWTILKIYQSANYQTPRSTPFSLYEAVYTRKGNRTLTKGWYRK